MKAIFVTACKYKELPIACVKEGCDEKIFVKDIKNFFNFKDEEYKALVDAAVEKYVSLNKQHVRYCLTPDCKMLYKTSTLRKTFDCPSCFAKICRSYGDMQSV